MKKTIAKVISIVCALSIFTACGNSSASQEELERLKAENESLRAEQSAETVIQSTAAVSSGWSATYDNCSLKIGSATLVEDFRGDPAIVVEMLFRNDSDKARSCSFTYVVDVYQDGVECESAILGSEYKDKFDTSTAITDIKPGVELKVYKAYNLRSESSDVMLEVRGLYDYNQSILFEKTFKI